MTKTSCPFQPGDRVWAYCRDSGGEEQQASVAETNTLLIQEEPSLSGKIEEARRRLNEVERSVNVLLDLAEQFGAASAGARLLEREAQQDRLRAELERLRRQQETRRLSISPDAVRKVLAKMRETLAGDDILAKRALLAKLIVGLEIGKGQGKVKYTFPLACAGLYTVPPAHLERRRMASRPGAVGAGSWGTPHLGRDGPAPLGICPAGRCTSRIAPCSGSAPPCRPGL